MSFRGGRGGGRFGGRGAGGPSGGPLTEEERNAGSYQFPTATYPAAAVPLQPRGSRAERLCASYFLQFKMQVQEGPFYLNSISQKTLDSLKDSENDKEQPAAGKKGNKKRKIDIEFDDASDGLTLNDGIKRYTDRYHKKKTLVKHKKTIDEHPYVVNLFPKELYETMGVVTSKKAAAKDGASKAARRLELSKFTSQLLMTETSAGAEDDEESALRKQKLKEKIEELKAAVANGEPGDEAGKNEVNFEEGEEEEEDYDEEYDEEEDDDYNAEKYFDDGGDMDDDDGNEEAAY